MQYFLDLYIFAEIFSNSKFLNFYMEINVHFGLARKGTLRVYTRFLEVSDLVWVVLQENNGVFEHDRRSEGLVDMKTSSYGSLTKIC